MSEIPSIVKKILNTAQTSSGRSAFLAGFTFYQLGRYNFTPGNDTAYIFLNTVAFVLAVLACAISVYVTYFAERAQTYNSKLEFQKRTNDLYIRGGFRCFVFGTIFYALGLGRIGWVYFPWSNSKYIPFVIFIICACCTFYGIMKIAMTQLSVISDNDAEKKKSEGDKAHLAKPEVDLENIKANATDLPDLLMKQSNLIAGRAVYVAGMIQNGIMRYRAQQPDDDNNIGHFYLLLCTVAAALALFAGMTLSTMAIFIEDTPDDLKVDYAVRVSGVVNKIIHVFNVSVVFCIVGIMVMPYGCEYSSYYASNIFLGAGSLVIFIYNFIYTYQSSVFVKSYPVRDISTDEASFNASRILSQVNNNGSQATLASAFVFYNIVTFFTDVLSLKSNSTYSPIYSGLFLIANDIAIIGGMTSALVDVTVTNTCVSFTDPRDQLQLLTRCRGLISLVDLLFYAALSGWYAVFILFGFAKTDPNTYIPLGFAVVGICITVGGAIYMDQATAWILYVQKYILNSNADHPENVKENINDDVLAQYARRRESFNDICYQVLFLGGFAYNAVCFFQFQGLAFDKFYLSLMSMSFVCSLSIVSWTSFYNIHFANCRDAMEKFYLAKYTNSLYKLVAFMAYIVIITLLVAFTMIGYVKSHLYYPNYKDIAPIMTIAAIVSIALLHLNFAEIYYKFKSIQSNVHLGSKTSAENAEIAVKFGDFSYSRMLAQMSATASACSFVAGNVCYEILFSQAAAPSNGQASNYIYFILDNWTFASGVAVVATVTTVSYLMQLLETEEQRVAFGRSIRYMKQRVFILTVTSLFTWMCSVIFMGYTKYTTFHRLTWPSFALGCIGSLLFLHMAVNMKLISNSIKRDVEEKSEVQLSKL